MILPHLYLQREDRSKNPQIVGRQKQNCESFACPNKTQDKKLIKNRSQDLNYLEMHCTKLGGCNGYHPNFELKIICFWKKSDQSQLGICQLLNDIDAAHDAFEKLFSDWFGMKRTLDYI